MESQVNSKFLLAVVGSPCFKDPPPVYYHSLLCTARIITWLCFYFIMSCNIFFSVFKGKFRAHRPCQVLFEFPPKCFCFFSLFIRAAAVVVRPLTFACAPANSTAVPFCTDGHTHARTQVMMIAGETDRAPFRRDSNNLAGGDSREDPYSKTRRNRKNETI